MKPELNQTQAVYPPEDPKPKVCVTTTIVEAQQVYIHECSSIAHRRISPDVKRVKLSFADSTASRQQATNF